MGELKAYGKNIGIHLLRLLLHMFDVFPIRKRRILFYSFNGKQYSDNPRCVTEALLAAGSEKNEDVYNAAGDEQIEKVRDAAADEQIEKAHDAVKHGKRSAGSGTAAAGKYELIWAFKNPDEFRDSLPDGVKTVRFRSPRYYYLAKTSRVLVFNVQGVGELARRKGQIFIQTWHASNGYKKIGGSAGIRRKNVLLAHRDYSYVCSGARSMTQRRIRGSMGFQGEVIKGTPRMDVLVNGGAPQLRKKVFEAYGLPEDAKLVLYAPTWTKDRAAHAEILDTNRLLAALTERFGGKWHAAIRLHPNVKNIPQYDDPRILEATKYPDMQELLCAADVLVSDYSSCVWDYSFTCKPCFLYCAGASEQELEEGFELPVRSWGFPVATTMGELEAEIREFDEAAFQRNVEKHHRDMGSNEDGRATERVVSLIRRAVG